MSEKFRWGKMGVAIFLLAISLVINSCNGGGDGSSVAGGGIGGSGISKGVITGFGSVFVNGVELDISGAVKLVDDNPGATEDDLQIGMKVEIEMENGSATQIEYEPEIKGPVESINLTTNSFVALGQTVFVDSTTIFRNINGLTDLIIGDNVEVSGFFDANGAINATFVEKEGPALNEFEVKGVVSNHDPVNKTFDINGLTVDYSGLLDPPVFDNGSFVEAEGDLQGNRLIATSIELEDPAADVQPGQEVEIEGIITKVNSSSDFEVNGQAVQTTPETIFENGSAADIALDIRVEAEGEIDANGILIAEKVQFRFNEEREFRIAGNVEEVDTVTSTIKVFGISITIETTTGLNDGRDQVRPFTINDIIPGDFVEIGGFVDSSGNLVAIRLERDDDPLEDRLRGPVGSETPNSSLVMLGISVDVTGADFDDINDNPIDSAGFFNTIDPGDIVDVKGSFANSLFSATDAEIEDLN